MSRFLPVKILAAVDDSEAWVSIKETINILTSLRCWTGGSCLTVKVWLLRMDD